MRPMKLTKSKTGPRTNILFRDQVGNRSVESITIYGVTPKQMRANVERMVLEATYKATQHREAQAGNGNSKDTTACADRSSEM